MLPQVPNFLERYQDIELVLQIGDRYVNLVDEGAELAIRIEHLEDMRFAGATHRHVRTGLRRKP
ncbi:hypothetical protein [Burkholderia sp. WAC0059]|uniref:hypothetical protein n=1 Tax=Burkholderia sp. WAC0059 TaxID=2066022 RepID=UPI002155122F|nr:hypothetical protein [Burkholderia sp. WAC0059]